MIQNVKVNNYIYKKITYKHFLKNVLFLSNSLKKYNNIILFLPNCYQYIELIFASLFSKTNIIHASYYNINKITNFFKFFEIYCFQISTLHFRLR